MSSYQNTAEIPAPDLVIIGAGIIGLWAAYFASQQGNKVLLVDKGKMASGATGGILGALLPHQPINWNEKKQFQLEGLTSLPIEIAKLEDGTGINCGYRRCGRVMPIANSEKRRQSITWADGGDIRWDTNFHWRVVDENPAKGWLADVGSHGYNADSFAARLNPRGLSASLIACLNEFPNVTIWEHCAVSRIEKTGTVHLANGATFTPAKTIVTAGYESFDLLKPVTGKQTGQGVKGQAALLKPKSAIDPAAPVLFDNGTYVIAHDNGLVAVGSTSENTFETADKTDLLLDEVIIKATALCPPLADAEIVERWAAVRPRAAGRDPMIGALPGSPNIIVATGGLKITMGIAHLMAQAALDIASDKQTTLPPSFHVENHL